MLQGAGQLASGDAAGGSRSGLESVETDLGDRDAVQGGC